MLKTKGFFETLKMPKTFRRNEVGNLWDGGLEGWEVKGSEGKVGWKKKKKGT